MAASAAAVAAVALYIFVPPALPPVLLKLRAARFHYKHRQHRRARALRVASEVREEFCPIQSASTLR